MRDIGLTKVELREEISQAIIKKALQIDIPHLWADVFSEVISKNNERIAEQITEELRKQG